MISLLSKYSIIYENEGSYKDSSLNYDSTSRAAWAHRNEIDPAPHFPNLGEDLSFEAGIHADQAAYLKLLLSGTGIALLTAPTFALTVLSWLFFSAFSVLITWRALLLFVGACLRVAKRPVPLESIEPDDLPIYTVLVPVYQEAELMPQISRALSRLDWPENRLDIQILLEADDPDTIAAAKHARFPANTRLVLIAPGGPRTKPNALNVGLSDARGQYLAIYDAEDLPHPNQLRTAFRAFEMAPKDVVCLQAPLIGEADKRSWLSEQWSLEYAVQFGLLMPAAALYRMPLLIGGTSNHFRKAALQALGGWDAWNVTEDADLGVRIARARLHCGMISSPTGEDAPMRLSVWMSQRSRWLKGFMQTWFVVMRTPRKTLKQMGALPFFAMQLSLGGAILAPIFHLPCLILLLFVGVYGPFSIGLLGTCLFLTALAVSYCGDLCAPGPWSATRWIAILTKPIYWPLHSIAAYRAIWELANRPFFWAKTPHTPRQLEDSAPCSTGYSASAS